MSQLLNGKKGLIMGVANDKSIAWGIAKAIADQGGELAFTYQGEALKKRVVPLANSVNSNIILPCDVLNDKDIDTTFKELEKQWSKLDFLVHAIAFSDRSELSGEYINTSRENFLKSIGPIRSKEVQRSSDWVDGYQFIPIDLPLIGDREYLFRMYTYGYNSGDTTSICLLYTSDAADE